MRTTRDKRTACWIQCTNLPGKKPNESGIDSSVLRVLKMMKRVCCELFVHRRSVRLARSLIETHDDYFFERGILLKRTFDFPQCNSGSAIDGEAICTRADGGKRDSAYAMRIGKLKTSAVTARK